MTSCFRKFIPFRADPFPKERKKTILTEWSTLKNASTVYSLTSYCLYP